ncbi:MAG: (deoxy)nucleoside triphosphate pyrophosphohydrolase [Firmicutes bacterium]|nr:(deoxy)nucleoside triphosphate pyrophosphohydrolase [Bacillota bacterium]
MIIKVVAALIEKDGKFLIAKRYTGDQSVFGKWEFPGGKVEENEDEFSAIEREIKEEFELDVKACEFLVNNVCRYPNKVVDLRLYRCEYTSGDFKLHDHSEYAWVNMNEIFDYDLALADIPLARYIIKNMSENKL